MKIKHYQPLTYITFSIVGITVLAGILLSSSCDIFNPTSALTKTSTANAAIRVRSTCSMTATIDSGNEHTATMINGQYKEDIGLTTIQTFCNDPNGYAIYAIGYTGGDTGVAAGTNTVLHSNVLGSTYDIATGIATSGDISNWAMKVSSVSGAYEPNILNGYNDYSVIPQSYTKVANYSSSTDLATIGSSLTTTYAAYIKPTQPSGTYEGQVKYVLVHPSTIDTNHYYMQDVEGWGNLLAVGQEVTAYDTRDNKSYTVRRMCMEGTGSTWQAKEANCAKENSMLWMTQNLDLDLNSSVALNSTNTDLNEAGSGAYTNGYVMDGDGIIYWAPANSTITDINTSTGSFNGWNNDDNVAYSADPDGRDPDNPWYATGEAYNSNLCFVSYDIQTCNYLNANKTVASTYFSHNAFAGNGNHGKIGNYYNWSAAIASNNSSGYNTNTQGNVANNPKNSICPKGWRLPTVSSVAAKSEFARLNNVYNGGNTSNGDKLVQSPLYMVRSGGVYGGPLSYAGYSGYYWSSTVVNAHGAYYLGFRSDGVYPDSGSYSRYYGWLVRCVSDY